MLEFLRGQRDSIRSLCGGLELDLELYHRIPVEIDVCCFGLDSACKLSDERYFVFYNQKQTPGGEIVLSDGPASGTVRLHLCLDRLPPAVDRLAITASIDGTRTMQELAKGHVRILRGQAEAARFSYSGGDFRGERAIVVCELYRRDKDWRFRAVGQGFNGGLKALVESFGGVVGGLPSRAVPAGGPAPAGSSPAARRAGQETNAGSHAAGARGTPVGAKRDPAAALRQLSALPPAVVARMDRLARQCRGDTEYLAGIFKSVFASLALYPRVAAEQVQVVTCCDASGSMFEMYRRGRIQRVVDKFYALAATLSDAGTMDLWAFGAKSRQFGAVTMDNVRDYTFAEAGGFERWMSLLNYQYNNEPEAMRDIMMIYGALKTPVSVLFITDGRVSSDWEIEEILIKTSRFPIFWQFIGLQGEEYGVLEHLDEIDGRYTSNASFLKFDDIDDVTNSALFEGLIQRLDRWLEEVKSKSMLGR